MKKLFLLLLVCATPYLIKAQDKYAEIKFDVTEIDYGTISKGSNGIRTFEFTNTGNAPLVVTNVKSSCGCTIPKKPEAPVAPGARGVIEVKYDTKRVGNIHKTITVYSNAKENPSFLLTITGTITNEKEESVLMKKGSIMSTP